MDQNVTRPPTPQLTHDDSIKRLQFLERALALEREKVAMMQAQQQHRNSTESEHHASRHCESKKVAMMQAQQQHRNSTESEHHASRHCESVSPFRSPRLGRQGLRRVNSVRSTTSLNSVSTPIFTMADMDKTGTVQAFAERKDREIFRQFHPRYEHRSSTRGVISRGSSSSGGGGDADAGPTISSAAVMVALKEQHGLSDTDPRLLTMWRELRARPRLTFSAFKAVKGNCVLMERALTGKLIIPHFQLFADSIDDCYRECEPDLPDPEANGDVARYIPSLAKVDPALYGVAVCTVDGQQHSVGDASAPFCIQSTSKPLT
jgi:hypothetical protein